MKIPQKRGQVHFWQPIFGSARSFARAGTSAWSKRELQLQSLSHLFGPWARTERLSTMDTATDRLELRVRLGLVDKLRPIAWTWKWPGGQDPTFVRRPELAPPQA